MSPWYQFFPGASSSFNQRNNPTIEQVSSTSIRVTIVTESMDDYPTSFRFQYTKLVSTGNPGSNVTQTVTQSSSSLLIQGLEANALYGIKTRASGTGPGAINGNEIYVEFKLSSTPVITPKTKDATTGESFLKLKGGTQFDNKYAITTRSFSAIEVPTASTQSFNIGSRQIQLRAYPTPKYYSFGTSFIFPPLLSYEPQEAGLGFFVGDGTGYYISFQTSKTSEANEKYKSPVNIFKLESKQKKLLESSSAGAAASPFSIMSGVQTDIDVRVQVGGEGSLKGTIEIVVYINNYKVTAKDTNYANKDDPSNQILPVTNKISLMAASGDVSFDYVYGNTISASAYTSSNLLNAVSGRFSDDYLQNTLGDLVYEAELDADTSKLEFYDEFGTTAREIVKKDIAIPSRPAYPLSWNYGLGVNPNISILSQSNDSFKSQVYILNNTSKVVPLSDGQIADFTLYGTSIGPSSDQIYTTEPESEYSVKEPVVFESTWIQSQEAAKSLADFIKSKVVNKSKIIDMEVFGNPLISVGDVITVKYPYHGFTGSEKIIVTNVNHIYAEGLSTQITGRTI